MNEAVCLVVEPMALVAEDLAMSVTEAWPGAKVIVAAEPMQAVDALASVESVCVAFVHTPPNGFAEGLLGAALAGRGAKVVFMGDRAEAAGGGFLVLQRPFAPETVAEMLARLQSLAGRQTVPG